MFQCDAPVSAGALGLRFFLTGLDDDACQEHREHLFRVDGTGLRAVAEALLSHLRHSHDNQSTAVGRAILGPKESPNWKPSSGWESVDITTS